MTTISFVYVVCILVKIQHVMTHDALSIYRIQCTLRCVFLSLHVQKIRTKKNSSYLYDIYMVFWRSWIRDKSRPHRISCRPQTFIMKLQCSMTIDHYLYFSVLFFFLLSYMDIIHAYLHLNGHGLFQYECCVVLLYSYVQRRLWTQHFVVVVVVVRFSSITQQYHMQCFLYIFRYILVKQAMAMFCHRYQRPFDQT